MRVLQSLDAAARPFANEIVVVLKSRQERDVRLVALNALWALGAAAARPFVKDIVEFYAEACSRPAKWGILYSSRIEGILDELTGESAPHFLKLLEDRSDAFEASDSAWHYLPAAVEHAAPEAKRRAAFLVAAYLDSDRARVRCWAVLALGCFGAMAARYINTIAALLRDSDREMRHSAANALGGLGEPAKPFIEQLRAADIDDICRNCILSCIERN